MCCVCKKIGRPRYWQSSARGYPLWAVQPDINMMAFLKAHLLPWNWRTVENQKLQMLQLWNNKEKVLKRLERPGSILWRETVNILGQRPFIRTTVELKKFITFSQFLLVFILQICNITRCICSFCENRMSICNEYFVIPEKLSKACASFTNLLYLVQSTVSYCFFPPAFCFKFMSSTCFLSSSQITENTVVFSYSLIVDISTFPFAT